MTAFNPRTKAPTVTEKQYISFTKGGNNPEYPIDESTGFTLPNCVSYAFGRAIEYFGEKPKLCQGNANKWYTYNDGYKRGSDPKLGAVVCFNSGSYGHVAIVEEIKNNGDIVVSQSHYNGILWDNATLTKSSGYAFNGNAAQGFIYCPIEFDAPVVTENYDNNTVQNRFKVVKNGKQIGAYTVWKNAKACADKNNAIITDGAGGAQIYPEFEIASTTETKNATTTIVLTASSYPNYTDGSFYRVRKSFNDGSASAGSFSVWKNAFSRWAAVKSAGYHIYDKGGNQLD